MTAHRIANIFWVILGFAICIYSWNLGIWDRSGPRTGFFPFIAGTMILGSGIHLIFHQEREIPVSWPDMSGALVIASILVGLAFVAFFAGRLGFLVSGAVLISGLFIMTDPARWRSGLVWGMVAATAIWFLFSRLLGVPLPRGPFGL